MPAPEASVYRHLILGSGPAGLTAAIYAARNNSTTLVIQGAQPGGQLTGTTIIDNFPGFAEGIDGNVLMQQMEAQARRFGASFVEGIITRVDLATRPFSVWLNDVCYRGDSIIICTGAVPRLLGLANEWELMGRGLSVCATCDAFFYKGKEVVVVGGGDTALDEAAHLARLARKVTIIHRRDTLRATPMLRDRALALPGVTLRLNTRVVALLGDRSSGVTGVTLQEGGGPPEELACDGIFVAIGHTPNTALFRDQLEVDADGYILTRDFTATSIPGVFAAGDVQDRHFRQAVTAAASGCMAAMQAERYLENLGSQGESPP